MIVVCLKEVEMGEDNSEDEVKCEERGSPKKKRALPREDMIQ